MLVSPSESPAFRSLGTSTWRTEDWGLDACWAARGMWHGVQRKTLKDLVASVEDGRLAKERLQWSSVSGYVYLIIESGERGGAAPREFPNGQLVSLSTFGRPWTGAAVRSLTYSLMADGVSVLWTADEAETIARVSELHQWTMKDGHVAARGRPACPVDVFGQRGSRQYGIWLLSSLPGVGTEIASRIYDEFGLPFRMTVSVKDLQKVKGVGKVMANRITEVFGDGS